MATPPKQPKLEAFSYTSPRSNMKVATPAKLEATIPDFSAPFDRSNVTFAFDDGKRLYFNRGTLAFFSPVFDRMLLGDWLEGQSHEKVPLPHKSSDDFHTVLRLLKVHRDELITDNNVAALLSLADEYEIESILVYCSDYILNHWQSLDRRFEALELAFQFGLRKVAAVFMPTVVCSSFEDLKTAAESLSLNVYAAVMHLRARRQIELVNKAGFVHKCYPTCVNGISRAFKCFYCGAKGMDCAGGSCSTRNTRASACRWCQSTKAVAQIESACAECGFSQGGGGALCVCGIDCDVWLQDEVVKMLLKKTN